MCLNKVAVRDYYRLVTGKGFGRVDYFPCGHCPACRQASANRRARRIRYHQPKGYTPYFVTLSYKDSSVPFVSRHDLLEAYSLSLDFKKYPDHIVPVSVYRDTSLIRSFGKTKLVKTPRNCIDVLPVDFSRYDFLSIKDLPTVRHCPPGRDPWFDVDKISVAYTPDSQKFLKRLRRFLTYYYGNKYRFTYYFCPEYGPTFSRFHMHYLIWFPSFLSQAKVRVLVRKAWPYADPRRTSQFTEVVKDSSSRYVASYINCDASVPQFLQENFKLRPSHSLAFGLYNDIFSLSSIISSFRQGSFRYNSTYIKKDGTISSVDLYYPKCVLYRYFPKVKGYSRLSRDTLFRLYIYPEKYLTHVPSYHRTTETGDPLYCTSLVDVYGIPIYMTDFECRNYIRRINYAYDEFALFGFDRFDFVRFVLDYLDGLSLDYYKNSQLGVSVFDSLFSFINLHDVCRGIVTNDTIYPLISEYSYDQLLPNNNPLDVSMSLNLIDQFNDNIKQRKISLLN